MEESQNNFQPQTKQSSCQQNFSNHETEAIFATECIEDSSMEAQITSNLPPLPSPQIRTEIAPVEALRQQTRIEDLVPELANFAAFDCEWHKENQDIYCFCLTDNTDHRAHLYGDRSL